MRRGYRKENNLSDYVRLIDFYIHYDIIYECHCNDGRTTGQL